jgi:Gas vesicle protein
VSDSRALMTQPVAVVDLLDRVLAKGVVISGELTLSLAGVDLVYVSLRALLSSVRPGVVPPDFVDSTTDDVGELVDGQVVEGQVVDGRPGWQAIS